WGAGRRAGGASWGRFRRPVGLAPSLRGPNPSLPRTAAASAGSGVQAPRAAAATEPPDVRRERCVMVPSSRTPEGSPNHCPICGTSLRLEPSQPAGDAPCPACGHLLWFLTPYPSPAALSPGGGSGAFRARLARLLPRLGPVERQI